MIEHSQFIGDIDGLRLMYESLGATRRRKATLSADWYAVFGHGAMDQVGDLLAEMHQYLHLPHPLPPQPPSDTDSPLGVATDDDFRLALETLLRLYRGAGEVRATIGQVRPGLCDALIAQVVPHLHAVQTALHDYLGWREVEATLAEMERRFAAEPVNGAAGEAAVPAAEARP
jgi:hypothetical protein